MRFLILALFPFLAFGQIVVHPISYYRDTVSPYDSMQFVAQQKPNSPVVYKKIYGNQLKNWISATFDSSSCGVTLDCDSTGTGKLVRQHSPTITGTLTASQADFSGNVSIGTKAFSNMLNVVGQGGSPMTIPALISVHDSTSIGANNGGAITFGGKYMDSTYTEWAGIAGLKENSTSGQFGGYLSMYYRTNGSGLSEGARISPAGNFLIGTSTDGGKKLMVNGTASATSILLQGGGANNGYVCYTASTHAFSVSDTTCPHP